MGRKVTSRTYSSRSPFLHWCRAHGSWRHFRGKETVGRRDEMADLVSRSFLEEDRYWLSSSGSGIQASTGLGHLMWLPTAACRVVRSGGAALDFGRRRIFGYPALGHIADVRLDPIAHLGFRGSFGYQWGASEFGLSRFVTLDSRQVESIDQVRGYHSGWRLMLLHIGWGCPHILQVILHWLGFQLR